MRSHRTFNGLDALRITVRVALFALSVMLPALMVQKVQANTTTIIEDTYKRSTGAGLVIVVSLQRA